MKTRFCVAVGRHDFTVWWWLLLQRDAQSHRHITRRHVTDHVNNNSSAFEKYRSCGHEEQGISR